MKALTEFDIISFPDALLVGPVGLPLEFSGMPVLFVLMLFELLTIGSLLLANGPSGPPSR